MKSSEDMTVQEKMMVVVCSFISGLNYSDLRLMEAAADMADELSNDPEFRALSVDVLSGLGVEG